MRKNNGTNRTTNVRRRKNYDTVAVWPGTYLGELSAADFVNWMKTEGGTRAQFLEVIETAPERLLNGHAVLGTGGRTDLFFAVHNDDVPRFAIWRLQYGIRWLTDVLNAENYRHTIYPERVLMYTR
jgi:hypothetical protein